ncbi:MAG: flagellar hook assembly protein FlgD [Pseudomonadota bacterium]
MNELNAALPSKLTDIPQERVKAKNTLGKDDFLKLLMAQLNNQDPLKPMEHQEFSAQLAQFGSLEQLQNIHKGIENLQGGMGNESKLSALGMIGKTITANGNEVDLMEGQSVNLSFSKKDGVTPVKAQIYSDQGKLVRELEMNAKASEAGLTWDGKDQEGQGLPSGKYTFRVQGVNPSGQAEELGAKLSGRVTAVEMNGNNPILVVQTSSGTAKLELAKVNSVAQEASVPVAKEQTVKSPVKEPAIIPNAMVPEMKVSDQALPEAEAQTEAEGPELETQWRGFPPFASFESLRP